MLESQSIRNDFFEGLATNMISEKLFAHITSIVFCMKDRNGRYVACNHCFANRLGLTGTDEVVGKTAQDLFPHELAKTYNEQDAFIFASGQSITDRLELVVTEGGRTFGWHLTSKIPLFDHQSSVHGIAAISQDLDQPSAEDISMAGLAKVSHFIRHHFDEPLRTAKLAEVAGISPTQLERKMRRIYKISVAQFIRKVRLEAAANLLLSSDLSLASIAADCGYSDQSAFTRQFKGALGMTPGAYRSHYRN